MQTNRNTNVCTTAGMHWKPWVCKFVTEHANPAEIALTYFLQLSFVLHFAII